VTQDTEYCVQNYVSNVSQVTAVVHPNDWESRPPRHCRDGLLRYGSHVP